MSESNPFIDRFTNLDIPALETQFNRAKALLPDFSITGNLLSAKSLLSTPTEELALKMLEESNRRDNSAGLQLGLNILAGLYPRMIVTVYFKDELTNFYRISFGTGVRSEHRGNHLLRLLFHEAPFPQDLDLNGAVFDPQRAAPVEIALFKYFLNYSQSSRDLVHKTLGISNERANKKDPDHSRAQEWLKLIRKLHGSDII